MRCRTRLRLRTSQLVTQLCNCISTLDSWKRERQRPFIAGTVLALQDTMDKRTYAVEPGLLFGWPGPNKSRWDLDSLKRRGLAVVVSLVHIEDPSAVARAGLKQYVIPFEDRLYLP